MWHLLEGGAYLKVRKKNNIKCQELVIILFKIRININFHYQKTKCNEKNQKYFHYYLHTSRIW